MTDSTDTAIKRKRRTKSKFVKFLEKTQDPQAKEFRLLVEQHKNNLISNNKQKYWSTIAQSLNMNEDEFKSIWMSFQNDAKLPKTNGSPYNMHMKQQIPTLRQQHPEMNHRDIFKMAAQTWKEAESQ